jgi:predicted enzyme related to lactoylglutathione lyase
MSTVHGAISFFELGVGDAAAGRAFYEGLFAWKFATGPSGNGWQLTTPGVPGGMHPNDAGGGPYLFFAVDDMDAALARVRELGGEILPDMGGEETAESIARFGRFKFCKDDQGSSFGLHQPPA